MVSSRVRVWRRFRKHKMAMAAGAVLIVMYLVMLFASFIAPYTDATEHRTLSLAPPTPIHVMHEGKFIGPFVYNAVRHFDPDTRLMSYQEDRSKPYRFQFFAKGDPHKLLWVIPTDRHLFGVAKPGNVFLFGTDQMGRDLLSRILYGSRVSLTVGIIAMAIYIPIGLTVGGIAGYFGGWVDNTLMRIVEALMAFPSFYLLLALFAATQKWEITSFQRYIVITAILSLLAWTGLARVIRGMVLSIKQNEYIEASKAAGASSWWIITKHVLPQTSTWVIISASLSVPSFILSESALSMLGVGVQEPAASWGNMLNQALDIPSLTLYPWLTLPGFFITIAIVAFNFLGDGLRDAFDTKRRV
ncbi:ABC transporter permease [bacterium]|nr:ABC transporter permease [bacterium]